MKVYIIGKNKFHYLDFIKGAEKIAANSIEEADLIILTGGADVHPKLYGEEVHPTTSYNNSRDISELIELEKVFELKKPILAVCRGSQLACVVSGGKLVQNISQTKYIHEVEDKYLGKYNVTSTHHQLQYPFNLPNSEYEILAYSKGLIKKWEGLPEGYGIPEVEPEIVFYNKTKMLAVQGHPEYADAPIEFVNAVNFYIKKYLNL